MSARPEVSIVWCEECKEWAGPSHVHRRDR